MTHYTALNRFVPLCVLLAFGSACSDGRSADQRADAQAIGMHVDSLAASGAHGYHVATYYVGRFKNTRMKEDPFAFNVTRLSPELEDLPLTFQVLDPGAFTLSYELGGKQQVLMGAYGSPVQTKEIEIEIVGPAVAVTDSALWWNNVAMGTYELRVFRY
jgi:hypothetical protein